MKNVIIWTVIAVGIVGGLVWFGNAQQQDSPEPALTFATIQKDTAAGAMLYDVRTSEEYNAGHFDKATLWPVEDMEKGKLPDVPKDTKLYVYCRSGNRSSQAAAILKDAGYTNIADLGGLPDVQEIGGVFVTEPGALTQ